MTKNARKRYNTTININRNTININRNTININRNTIRGVDYLGFREWLRLAYVVLEEDLENEYSLFQHYD